MIAPRSLLQGKWIMCKPILLGSSDGLNTTNLETIEEIPSVAHLDSVFVYRSYCHKFSCDQGCCRHQSRVDWSVGLPSYSEYLQNCSRLTPNYHSFVAHVCLHSVFWAMLGICMHLFYQGKLRANSNQNSHPSDWWLAAGSSQVHILFPGGFFAIFALKSRMKKFVLAILRPYERAGHWRGSGQRHSGLAAEMSSRQAFWPQACGTGHFCKPTSRTKSICNRKSIWLGPHTYTGKDSLKPSSIPCFTIFVASNIQTSVLQMRLCFSTLFGMFIGIVILYLNHAHAWKENIFCFRTFYPVLHSMIVSVCAQASFPVLSLTWSLNPLPVSLFILRSLLYLSCNQLPLSEVWFGSSFRA